MSPNPAADTPDPVRLSGRDVLLAGLLHVAVILALIALTLWRPTRMPAPPKALEVHLVSADILKKERPKPKPRTTKPRVRKQPKPRVRKPAARHRPKKKSVKQRLKKPKPRLAAPKSKKVRPLPKDYDPFAPLISKARPSSRHVERTAIVADLRRQLSEKELHRYIAMIQAAVLKHWKVPADLSNFKRDPMVTMELNPDGSVRRLNIEVSSGSAALDDSLIRAIRAAAPFTLPRRQFEVFRTNRIRFHPLR